MRTKLRSKVTLLFMTCAVVLAIPAIALADNVKNDVVAGGNDTIVTGGSTTINYEIQQTGSGGLGGCDATTASPVTVNINAPAGVTASPSSLSFNSCGTSKSVSFTSSTAGTYDITVSTVDNVGDYNVAPAKFTLHVNNPPPPANDPPTLSLPANQTAEATSAAGAVVNYTASATDAQDDPDPTPNCSPASGSTFPLGSTTVNCSVTDSGGLSASGFFTVTVQDTTAPSLTLPDNQTAEATGPGGAHVSFSAPSASDIVDGAITPVCDAASGDQFPVGITTVHCTATDAHGNNTSGSFTVTVTDNTPPTLTLPDNQTAEATGPGGAHVSFSAPSASDIVDGAITPVCDAASGDQFPLGTTTVHCTATDNAGNTANGSFTVTVEDTTAPELTLPGNITREATGPNGAPVDFSADVSATDLVDGDVDVTCDPASGTFPIDTTTVECSATDAAGNTATDSFTVTVQDTAGPVLSLPANITTTATSNSKATVNFTATANDVVDGSRPVNCNPASGTLFSAGTTTVNCSSTDSRGNTSNGSFTVTVNYNWSGFFRPVDNPDTVNSVKAGQSIPVKFSLAGNQGLNIFAANFPVSQKITCDTSDPVDAIEETLTAGGSSLSYDSSLDQYNYVWKTDKSWAGTCRQLTVKTADGTPHIAIFKLLK